MSFTAGSIGGTYKEKLTVENLPSHDHALRLMVNTYAQGGGTYSNGQGFYAVCDSQINGSVHIIYAYFYDTSKGFTRE